MRYYLFGCFVLLTFIGNVTAQYPPPVGEEGTTAIHGDSTIIIGWGMNATINRGLLDVAYPELGDTSFGEDEDVLGRMDSVVVSLGDGGVVTMSFMYPLYDGEGWDFAVFENSFDGLFLELAFVEVSSDGEQYYRFPSASLTNDTVSIGSFGLIDARGINNLAGKYMLGFGAPFDLNELQNIEGLDVDHIMNVRIIDVVGTLDEALGSYDAEGRKINDPYPTAFPSGGFDLDAIGVRYWNIENGNEIVNVFEGNVFPNPIQYGEELVVSNPNRKIKRVEVYAMNGKKAVGLSFSISPYVWGIKGLKAGVWLVVIDDGDFRYGKKVIVCE